MTTDLRELLRKAREQMLALTPGLSRDLLIERIDAALAEKTSEPVEDTGPRKIGGPFIPQEIARNARNAASGKPILYLCPAGCGCTWHDNDDGTMSLGLWQRSCEVCEFLPLDKLVALYAAPPPAGPSDARVDWSWIRSVLSQGASIQQDYQAGKYPTYEHYAARLDEAARERMAAIETSQDARDAARYRKLRYVGAYLSDRLLFRDELDKVVDGFIEAAIEREEKS